MFSSDSIKNSILKVLECINVEHTLLKQCQNVHYNGYFHLQYNIKNYKKYQQWSTVGYGMPME